MPETNVLYSVTAAVILGLIAWVATVLKQAKEPWARPQALSQGAAEPSAKAGSDADAVARVEPKCGEK